MHTDQSRQILSVSQLNRSAKNLLETYLPLLWVEGEISNFSQPSSGHWYFTLKDTKAQVRCAMFRNRNTSVNCRPQQGDKVLVRARVSLYEGRGEYQLIAEHMEPAGTGQLQVKFEALKTALSEEGLFAQAKKQPLPASPSTIGVITSPTGAVIADILNVLKRRAPSVAIKLLPVAVQGLEAAEQIANAIQSANAHQIADVLIIGRGGGSLEDLWAFNEEVVARAIYASALPVISAVGHEVDVSIADFVADVRAPTPSAAAELAVPDTTSTLQLISQTEQRLFGAINRALTSQQLKLNHLKQRLRHPGERIAQQAQQLDTLEVRLLNAIKRQLMVNRQKAQQLQNRLQQCSPEHRLTNSKSQLTQIHHRLIQAIQTQVQSYKQQLQHNAQMLHSLSPLATLERGYAIVWDEKHKALKSTRSIKPGKTIQAKLHQGTLHCTVNSIQDD